VKTLTFWSVDDDVSGITSLLRGVVLEAHAHSVYDGGQRYGEEGGGLIEDSRMWCPRQRKVVRRRALT
jgi:hypothetical protein